ncbi:MAG: SH3 domain-containing protein [Maritimibacter sp.]
MGLIRLTLITLVLLWLGMKYFGRDEGLSGSLIGRDPDPAPVTVVAEVVAPATPPVETAPAPATETDTAESDGFDPVAGLVSEINNAAQQAIESTLQPADASAAEPEPEPEAQAEPPVEPAAEESFLPAEDDPTFMPTPEPAPTLPEELYVTGTKVNMRSGPSTANSVIGALVEGTVVSDLGDAGDGWRQIQTEAGEIGFMSSDFLAPLE